MKKLLIGLLFISTAFCAEQPVDIIDYQMHQDEAFQRWYLNSDAVDYDDPYDLSDAREFDYQKMSENIHIGRLMSDTIFQMEDDYDKAMDDDDSLVTQASMPMQETRSFKDNKAVFIIEQKDDALTLLKKNVDIGSYHQVAVTEAITLLKQMYQGIPFKRRIAIIFTCHVCKFGNLPHKNPSFNKSSIKIKDFSKLNDHFMTKKHQSNLQCFIDHSPSKEVLIEFTRCMENRGKRKEKHNNE